VVKKLLADKNRKWIFDNQRVAKLKYGNSLLIKKAISLQFSIIPQNEFLPWQSFHYGLIYWQYLIRFF
jgi:hypothetical protein